MARIRYVLPAEIDEPEMREWLEKSIRDGKPGPEIQAIRAHSPGVMRSFTRTREWIFHSGALDYELKEMLRGYIATSAGCVYCSNQGVARDWQEDRDQLDEILHHRRSEAFSDREKAALEYADAIMWDPASVDDALWERLRTHFDEEQLVELGYWIGFTFGGQRWLKTLDARQGELAAAMEEAETPVA
ncbi:MAG: carboxymuconolactone decarboxylase family protein [Actinomycetota bacterium]